MNPANLPPYDPELDEPPELEDQAPELEDQAPELERELEPAPAPAPRFRYNDRLYALGMSGAGKSEVLNIIFSGVRCQRILFDTKPEFAIPDVDPVSSPDAIDWTEPTIHYVPAPGSDCEQYETIFERMLTVPGAIVACAHEVADLVDYKPGKAGRYLRGYMAKGNRLGKGGLWGTQRPFLVPTGALSEANHALVFPPQLARADDMKAAAEALSPVNGEVFTSADLARELALLEQEHGQYAFLWRDRQMSRILHAFAPLPDPVRNLSVIRRTEDA